MLHDVIFGCQQGLNEVDEQCVVVGKDKNSKVKESQLLEAKVYGDVVRDRICGENIYKYIQSSYNRYT